MARRTKEEAARTRQAIIDAASRVFHARGVARTSLDEVAAAAGVTRGAVYWHFKDKIELFFAVRDNVPLPLVDGVEGGSIMPPGSDDALRDIGRALASILEGLAALPELKRAHQLVAFRCEYVAELQPAFDRIYRAPHQPLVRLLRRAYSRAAAQGHLRRGLAPGRCALDTAAFINGVLDRWLAEDGSPAVHRQSLRMVRDHIALRRA
jgi:TetR/AcrR family acrAB operon transcriptional repressor